MWVPVTEGAETLMIIIFTVGLAVRGFAIPKPGCDVAGQDALYNPSVKRGESCSLPSLLKTMHRRHQGIRITGRWRYPVTGDDLEALSKALCVLRGLGGDENVHTSVL